MKTSPGMAIHVAEARIPRACRSPLRDLDGDAYKALLQLVLLKTVGQEVRVSFASFEELTGVPARRCATVLQDLVRGGWVTVVKGRPLGRGKGFSPMSIRLRPLRTELDDAPEEAVVLDLNEMQNRCETDAITMQLPKTYSHPLCNGSASVLHGGVNSEVRVYREGGGGGLTRASATPTPPTPAWAQGLDETATQRLAAVAEHAITIDAKPDTRDRWIRETDGLTPDAIRGVFAARGTAVIAWPSEFAALRRTLAQRATTGQRRTESANAATQRAERERQRAAEDAREISEAHQRRNALAANGLGAGWAKMTRAWGLAVPWVLVQRTTWPTALIDGRLVVHVGQHDHEPKLRAVEADLLARAADAYAQPCDHLDLIVNGHSHPTAAALPGIACTP